MKSKSLRIFLTLFIAGFLLASFSVALALGPGDGNILRRGAGITSGTPDEICHSCHKTYKNAPADPDAIKSHSSSSTSKWPAGWGTATGKYGEFVCTTCHTGHDTKNIYLIKETITAPNSPTDTFPGSTVDFRTKAGLAGDVGLMADDTACFLTQHTSSGACSSGGGVWNPTTSACYAPNAALQADCTALSGTWTPRTTSTRVCEVCHSKNKYHNYNANNNQTNGGNFSHNNAGDCNGCHLHRDAFQPAGGGACNSCHGSSGTTGAPLITSDLVTGGNATGSVSSGKHQKHVVDLGYTACTTCHTGYVMPDSSQHAIDIGFNNFGSGGGAYKGQSSPNVNYNARNGTVVTKDNSRTCNLYCHSTVQGAGGTGAPQYASPAWNDTVQTMTCSSCHVNMATDATGTGSHLKHANTSTGYSMTCANCHAGYSASSTNASTHVNNTINVAVSATYGGTYSGGTVNGDHAPGGGYGNCSTVYCHSDGLSTPVTYANPTWGGTVNCGDCHGATAAAPPASTPHTKHVGTAAGYKFACSRCHDSVANTAADSTNPTTIKSKTLHVNQQREVAMDAAADGSYTSGSGCSATYCHSEGKNIGAGPYVQQTTPQPWSGSVTCSTCHTGGTTTGPSYSSGKANSHNKHVVTNSYVCVDCHSGTVNSSNAIIDGTKHANKAYDVTGARISGYTYNVAGGTCSTACHGSTSPQWGATMNCTSCHDASNTGLSTRHAQHYNTTTAATANVTTNSHTANEYVFGCGNCHPSSNHAKGSVSNYQDAEINGTKQTSANYSPAGTNLVDAKGFKYTNYGSCTTVCHTRDGLSGAPVVAANWGTAPTGTCGVCHNKPGDLSPTWSAPHSKHLNTYAANTNINCGACHSGTATSNTLINGASGRNQHPNANKEVAMGTFPGGTVAGSQGAQTCSNVYCHGDGSTTTPTVGPISWSGTYSTCGECHGNASTLATGQHNKHIGSLTTVGRTVGCADCHSATASNNTTISNYANHVNKNLNIKFDNSINLNSDAPTYNGTSTTGPDGATKTPGSAGYTCASVYCHSTGNVNNAGVAVAPTTFRPIAWNAAAIGCDGCHGDQAGKAHPTYATGAPASATANSHVKHVESSSYGCDYCHNTTTADTSTSPASVISGGAHLNRQDDVSFKTNGGKTGSYSASAKTCSTTYCHGTAASPAWGTTGGTTCATCHDATSALALRHDRHFNSTTAATVLAGGTDAHTATAYVYACLNCHPTNQHATGPASAVAPLQDAAVTGAKVTAYTKGSSSLVDGKGFNYTTNGTCTTVCHTRDGASGAAVVAVNWGTASTGGCAVCHRASGDNYATMTGYTDGLSAPHSQHMATDRYGSNGLFGCSTCHNTTAASNTTINGIAGRNQHPNATKNVDFNAATVGGSWSGTQCSNTYCHSSGTSATGSHGLISWSGSMVCSSCHNGAATLSTGSHNKHLVLSGVTCSYCHNATASDNSTLNSYANHVNKNATINFNASAAGASGAYAGNTAGGATVYQKPVGTAAGACSTTVCHGGVSGTWGVADTNDTCTKCHGTPTLTVTVANRYVVAPPNDTAGQSGSATDTGQVSNDAQVGAHQTHLRYLNGLRSTAYDSNDDRCGYCHGALPGSGLHANGSATPAFQGLATHSGTMSPAPSYSLGACNNTYCHNPAGTGGSLNALNAGSATAPTWTNAALIADGTLKTYANCNKCHLVPDDAGFTSTTSHTGYTVAATDCSGCHGHNGETSGILGQRHIDGTKYGGGNCNSCHDYDVNGATYAGGVWSGGTWGKAVTGSNAEGFGAHAKHINHIKTRLSYTGAMTPTGQTFGTGEPANICGTCHTNTAGNHVLGGSTARTINFGDATYKTGGSTGFSFLFDPSAPTTNPPIYNGNSTTSSSVNPKSCSNISCHFTTTPVWNAY
jgi:predicted CxxxxCH...CXXCH cytochrome family protein